MLGGWGGGGSGSIRKDTHTHTRSGSKLTLPLTDACLDRTGPVRKHTADGELVQQ